jgi:hypothetical protein
VDIIAHFNQHGSDAERMVFDSEEVFYAIGEALATQGGGTTVCACWAARSAGGETDPGGQGKSERGCSLSRLLVSRRRPPWQALTRSRSH